MDGRQRLLVVFGVGFLAYAGTSLLWSASPAYGGLWLASLAAAYCFGAWIRDAESIWGMYIVLTATNLALAIAWPKGLALDLTNGVFGNANFFGCALVLALAAALAYRFIWFIPIGFLGLIYTQSRGALVSGALTLLVGIWRWNWVIALLALCAMLIYGVTASTGRDASFWARMGIWQDTLNHTTFFGSGFGSFYEAYGSWPIHIGMTGFRAAHAYNDALELIFDLGIGVVLLWVFLAFALEAPGPARLICFAFILCSLTFFPLYLAPLGQLFAFALGSLNPWRLYGPLASNCKALS